jgi:hypothetical protein
MRFRSANISVAASRTTVRRRIVEFSQPGPRRKTIGGAPVITTPRAPKKPRRASSSMMLAVDDRAVKAAPPGGRRPALTALLYLNVPRKALKGRSCDHLTSRSTSVRSLSKGAPSRRSGTTVSKPAFVIVKPAA